MVVARIQAPKVEPGEPQFGLPIWVKVYTTETEGPVGLEELVGNGEKIEIAKSHTEIEWQLVQKEFNNPASGFIETGGEAGAGADAVIRRYEFFAYAGVYDENHQAKVIKDDVYGDSNPAPGDIGGYLGAQNGAVNLVAIAPVPEPETYAMLLAGLGLVAGMVRRRRRSRAAACS